MTKYTLCLDSSQSSGFRPSASVFQLNQPLINCSQVKVLGFTFGNNLFNVVEPYNNLSFDSVTVVVPEGYYTAQEFITYLNTELMTRIPFTSQLTTETKAIELIDEVVSWTIGSNDVISGGLYSVFSFYTGYSNTGNFQSSIYLAQPCVLSLNCQQLIGNDRYVTTKNMPITMQFWVGQVQSAYGEVEAPNSSFQMTTQLSNVNLSQLNLLICDAITGRQVTELSHFNLLLEIIAN